jgi:hypothetical protein
VADAQRLPIPPQTFPDAEYCREGPNGHLWLWNGRLYVEDASGSLRRAFGRDLDAPECPKLAHKQKGTAMPVAMKSRPKSATKSPDWKSLPDAEKAAHLLAKTTIPDAAWTSKKRRKDEDRASFIKRVLSS